jgi:hypothetical protein
MAFILVPPLYPKGRLGGVSFMKKKISPHVRAPSDFACPAVRSKTPHQLFEYQSFEDLEAVWECEWNAS